MQNGSSAAKNIGVAIFDGWQGIVLIASTYVYFLIFAQFGFLKRLAELGIVSNQLKPVMGAMALGGIAASLFSPRLFRGQNARSLLQLALLTCATAAALTVLPVRMLGSLLIALFIGLSLGLLTVTLVANLRLWIGVRQPLLKIGLGTGLGYLICNFPPLFTASPRHIAFSAMLACGIGLVAASRPVVLSLYESEPLLARQSPPFVLVLLWFTALVWFDSAAFFIIQNSPALQTATWHGGGHLWLIGSLHLLAALAGAWFLRRTGVPAALLLAFALLAAACLLLLNPSRAVAAAVFYPIGVSIYSVALVAYPSFLMGSYSDVKRSQRAGIIYAVAGWIGSAMGIGMAQNLHHVPPAFVAAAAVLFLLPVGRRFRTGYKREALAVITVLAAAFAFQHLLPPSAGSSQQGASSIISRGRGVYISEGCINCHSQYVRPHSPDVEMWGPVGDLDAIRREKPPLIGNRRQGPDLSEVGSRRSPLWLRIHLMRPRDVSYDSVMPEYGYLFHDWRGDALVAYLASLHTSGSTEHLQKVMANWRPSPQSIASAHQLNGETLFREHCATCHTAAGRVRTQWAASFRRLPPNLFSDSLRHVSSAESSDQRRLRVAQIIKFGLPGTDMPGHEYLPDDQIEVIAGWVVGERLSAER